MKKIGKIIKKTIKSLNVFTATKRKIENNGERVFINLNKKINYDKLDMYEKNHYKRYEFASDFVKKIDDKSNLVVGDFACGSGYGTCMLSSVSKKVIGVDICPKTIEFNKKNYKTINNIEYHCENLVNLDFANTFDLITSFETIEHLEENNILAVLDNFYRAMKSNGYLVFSVPYMQEDSEIAREMGFHKTFFIDENKLQTWLSSKNFIIEKFYYQNYSHHELAKQLNHKDMIVCIAKKSN